MILAWWDLDVRIGSFHQRKVTARPLRDLEKVLGHRIHVEGWQYNEFHQGGVWKFNAYNYIETSDPALAMYATIKQLAGVSPEIAVGWSGYNKSARHDDDFDVATIASLYWCPPNQIGLSRYVSSGVLLAFAEQEKRWCGGQQELARRCARPVVKPLLPGYSAGDYVADFTVRIVCGNKKDVIEYHWPRFQSAHFPDGVDEIDIDNRTHAGKPNIIRVRQTLRGLQEHEAVAHCLANAAYFQLRLESGRNFRFTGELPSRHTYRDGIYSFELTRLKP